MHWYFVKIKSHSYKLVVRAMQHDHSYDKTKVILLSYMTPKGNMGNLSYLAIEAEDRTIHRLKHQIPQILYILGEKTESGYQFYHASEKEIELIKGWVSKSIYLYQGFKPGDQVKIMRGLFKDFKGEIVEPKPDNTAKVSLSLSFHKVDAMVSLQDVEKI